MKCLMRWFASFNGTFHISLNENICSIAWMKKLKLFVYLNKSLVCATSSHIYARKKCSQNWDAKEKSGRKNKNHHCFLHCAADRKILLHTCPLYEHFRLLLPNWNVSICHWAQILYHNIVASYYCLHHPEKKKIALNIMGNTVDSSIFLASNKTSGRIEARSIYILMLLNSLRKYTVIWIVSSIYIYSAWRLILICILVLAWICAILWRWKYGYDSWNFQNCILSLDIFSLTKIHYLHAIGYMHFNTYIKDIILIL